MARLLIPAFILIIFVVRTACSEISTYARTSGDDKISKMQRRIEEILSDLLDVRNKIVILDPDSVADYVITVDNISRQYHSIIREIGEDRLLNDCINFETMKTLSYHVTLTAGVMVQKIYWERHEQIQQMIPRFLGILGEFSAILNGFLTKVTNDKKLDNQKIEILNVTTVILNTRTSTPENESNIVFNVGNIKISIPFASVSPILLQKNKSITATAIIVKKLSKYFPKSWPSMTITSETALNSPLISIAIGDARQVRQLQQQRQILSPNVKFHFRIPNSQELKPENGERTKCAWLRQDDDREWSKWSWSIDGCVTTNETDTFYTVCECDRLAPIYVTMFGLHHEHTTSTTDVTMPTDDNEEDLTTTTTMKTETSASQSSSTFTSTTQAPTTTTMATPSTQISSTSPSTTTLSPSTTSSPSPSTTTLSPSPSTTTSSPSSSITTTATSQSATFTTPPSTTFTSSSSSSVTSTTTASTTINPADQINNTIQNIQEIFDDIEQSSNLTGHKWFDSLCELHLQMETLAADHLLPELRLQDAIFAANLVLATANILVDHRIEDMGEINFDRHHAISILFRTIDHVCAMINAKQVDSGEIFLQFKFSNIEMQSKLLSANDDEWLRFEFRDNIEGQRFVNEMIELPLRAINNLSAQTKIRMGTKSMFSSSAVIVKKFAADFSYEDQSDQFLINSNSISIKIAHFDQIELRHPFRLRFVSKNIERLQFGDRPICGFWKFSTPPPFETVDSDVSGNISSQGCAVDRFQSNRTHTVCECDHLTDFLAITDILNREKPDPVKSALTYVCSSISCVFLVATLVIALRVNRAHYTMQEDQFNVRRNRYQLSLSIATWLLIAHLLIMFGLDRTEYRPICDLNSILLLFALLATFAFMFMFSIQLYCATSRRYVIRYFFSFRNFAIAAYSFAATIIAVSLALILTFETFGNVSEMFDSLAGEYFCWLSSTRYPHHIWIFVAPVTVIIAANTVILIAILGTVFRNRSVSTVASAASTIGDNAMIVYILLFNFGIPWIMYIFYINDRMAHIFSYAFIVINGTQGIALFAEQYQLYRLKVAQRKRRSRLSASSLSSKATILASSQSSSFSSVMSQKSHSLS